MRMAAIVLGIIFIIAGALSVLMVHGQNDGMIWLSVVAMLLGAGLIGAFTLRETA